MNISFATPEVFEVNFSDIRFVSMDPRSFLKLATILTVDTIEEIHRRWFFCIQAHGVISSIILLASRSNPQGPWDQNSQNIVWSACGWTYNHSVQHPPPRCIAQQKARVFNHDYYWHNMMLGRKFLSTGIKLTYDTGHMQWYDSTLPIHVVEV